MSTPDCTPTLSDAARDAAAVVVAIAGTRLSDETCERIALAVLRDATERGNVWDLATAQRNLEIERRWYSRDLANLQARFGDAS